MSRQTRSQAYQFKFAEVFITDEYLKSFSNSSSLGSQLNPYQYDERIFELEDKLKEKFWQIAENILTENQKLIIKLTCDGYTQMEIAKMLNVNQSSVCKCLSGNIDYSTGTPRVYGGILKKLHKFVLADPEIKEILKEMAELREEVL